MSTLMTVALIAVLFLAVVFAVYAVMLRNIIKSSIALSFTGVCITVALFILGCPLAAVFELSVCAGLITVVFIGAVSLTKPYPKDEVEKQVKARRKSFLLLPVLLVVAGFGALMFGLNNVITPDYGATVATFAGFKDIFWNFRQVDVLGLIIVILVGALSIVLLFKESDKA